MNTLDMLCELMETSDYGGGELKQAEAEKTVARGLDQGKIRDFRGATDRISSGSQCCAGAGNLVSANEEELLGDF